MMVTHTRILRGLTIFSFSVYVIIGIFCLAASIGLYSCLSPFVRRFPLGKCRYVATFKYLMGNINYL